MGAVGSGAFSGVKVAREDVGGNRGVPSGTGKFLVHPLITVKKQARKIHMAIRGSGFRLGICEFIVIDYIYLTRQWARSSSSDVKSVFYYGLRGHQAELLGHFKLTCIQDTVKL